MLRKGFLSLGCILGLSVWSMVYAEQSADELAAMIEWWENYGRYWSELDNPASSNDTMMFSLLEGERVPLKDAIQ
ncbi:hypothetical protein [uncultured Thiothrix sp.]|uniref:hypothetical protein n=1 Tax=uncultured Thiothrix sp. TaxID=223185 RepID=UPI002632958B|nr:hypothetical protein [uncultured Thiothrix sp.]HMT94280.1 hypothetical protein [Thiolinea sp.]